MAEGWRKHSYDRRSLGAWLRSSRTQLHLTQNDITKATGLHKGTISKAENGRDKSSLQEPDRARWLSFLFTVLDKQGKEYDRSAVTRLAGLNTTDGSVDPVRPRDSVFVRVLGPLQEIQHQASDARRQGAWSTAEALWLAVAKVSTGSEYGCALIQAGEAQINQSKLPEAQKTFTAILRPPTEPGSPPYSAGLTQNLPTIGRDILLRAAASVGIEPVIDALTHLGWVYRRRDEHEAASAILSHALELVPLASEMSRKEAITICDKRGRVLFKGSADLAHVVGRLRHQSGKLILDQILLNRVPGSSTTSALHLALQHLSIACAIHENIDSTPLAVGWDVLIQAVALAHLGKGGRVVEEKLELAEGIFRSDRTGVTKGYLSLYRGMIGDIFDWKRSAVFNNYEVALGAFQAPTFYPGGICVASLQAAEIVEQDSRQGALEFALVAAALDPWPLKLDVLGGIAYRRYRELGKHEFIKIWQGTVENLWFLDERVEAFRPIRPFIKWWEPEDGSAKLRDGLYRAIQVVATETTVNLDLSKLRPPA